MPFVIPSLRTVLFRLHWALGLTAGFILALMGVTGALISYEEAVTGLANRDRLTVTAGDRQALPPAALAARIAAQAGFAVNSLTLSDDPAASVPVRFARDPATRERPPALYAELEQRGYVISDPLSLVTDDAGMMEGVDAWVRRAAAAMATVFLSMSYILSPEVHVIGGQLPAFVLERLCAALNARFDEEGANAPLARFFPSTAERDAAAVGGAVLVFQNCLLPGDGLNMEV